MDQTDFPHEAWQRLGHSAKRRRLELGYNSQPELAAAGGPSTSLISKIEGARGYPYSDRVIIRLEDALRWKRGSAVAILNDQEPTAQTTSDTEMRQSGSRFPENYPDVVGDDPFLRYIWDYPGTDASQTDRYIAVASVRLRRETDAAVAAGEQGQLRQA